MATSPPIIYTPPSAGAAPSAPLGVFNASLSPTKIGVTGISSPVPGGLFYAGEVNGRSAWSANGTLVVSDLNMILSYTGTQWQLRANSVYNATKTSTANSPLGLTAWTIANGTGQPVLTANPVYSPPVITA